MPLLKRSFRGTSTSFIPSLRQVRDPHLAQGVAQAVFIILARKAGSLCAPGRNIDARGESAYGPPKNASVRQAVALDFRVRQSRGLGAVGGGGIEPQRLRGDGRWRAAVIFFLLRRKKHSTFNIQHRTSNEGARSGNIGRWKLNVECSMFPKPKHFSAGSGGRCRFVSARWRF